MASTGKKWLVGCGIGCGLILLVLAGVGTVGYFAVRDIVHQAKDIDEGQALVDSTFGDPGDYTPAADGHIPAERLETFLGIREKLKPVRGQTDDLLLTLQGNGEGGVLGKFKAGVRFVPAILGFINERNLALVDAGMGQGEYQYIYSLAYYGLLAKDPADGPKFSLISNDDHDGKNFHMRSSFAKKDTLAVRRKRSRMVRQLVNRTQKQILANQLEALEADPRLVAVMPGWRDSLAAEVEAMESDARRLPWQGGMPDRIRTDLSPFGARLDSLYDPLSSGLEMGLTRSD